MKVKASEFHPMRGHVDQGIEVVYQDKPPAFVKSDMRGWSLVDGEGHRLAGPGLSAYELTDAVTKRIAA